MLDIGREAVQHLKEYRQRRGPDSCVRIAILSGSTTGPSLGVTIDDKTDRDEAFVFDDMEVIVDRALLEYCEKITIEYVLQKGGGCSSGGGFKITAKNGV